MPRGAVLYYRDVTRRSTAEVARAARETALQATAEQLRVLIPDAPLGVVVLDNRQRVQLWNPAAEAMFQWTAAEIVGRPLPPVPDEELEAFEHNLKRTHDGVSIKGEPVRWKRKDGVILDVQLSSSPLRDASGAVIGANVMIADVTAQRKLEAQLRMAQKMEAVGLLAGGVAHDFNNLLTAIKGFTSLLQLTHGESDQATEFLGEINKAADRAAALTAQLLAFSRRQLL